MNDSLPALLEGRYDLATEAWERAFVACAQGRFSDTLAIGTSCLTQVALPEAARLKMSMGSALRQMHRYKLASEIDCDDERFPVTSRAHLAISRAADHVGLVEPDAAEAVLLPCVEDLWSSFEAADDPIEFERARIRHSWVATEIALTRGDIASALRIIDPIYRSLQENGRPSARWPRHVAKTALFLGVVCAESGLPREAREALMVAIELAGPIGAKPVLDVAAQVLASLAT